MSEHTLTLSLLIAGGLASLLYWLVRGKFLNERQRDFLEVYFVDRTKFDYEHRGGLRSVVPVEDLRRFEQRPKSDRALKWMFLIPFVVGGVMSGRGWISGTTYLFVLICSCNLILLRFLRSYLHEQGQGRACHTVAGPNYLLLDYYRSSPFRLLPWYVAVFGSVVAFVRIVHGEWWWAMLLAAGPVVFVLGQIFFRSHLRLGPDGIFDGRDFYTWDQMTWYRWYEHREAILVGVRGNSRFQPYLVIPFELEQAAEIEEFLMEHASGKRLEDVEDALAAVHAKKNCPVIEYNPIPSVSKNSTHDSTPANH